MEVLNANRVGPFEGLPARQAGDILRPIHAT
jgi:hypothetical protein